MLIAADSPPDRVSTALHAAVSPETLPPTGGYRIKLAHSTLCLSEDSGRVYQRDCARAMPTMALRLVRDDVYRILTHHPRFGGGCMGVPKASVEAGAAVYNGFCDTGAAEDFQLVPSESPSTGFRLHAAHSNLCLGVLDVSMADWTPVFQLPCDSSGAGQTFTFEPRAGQRWLASSTPSRRHTGTSWPWSGHGSRSPSTPKRPDARMSLPGTGGRHRCMAPRCGPVSDPEVRDEGCWSEVTWPPFSRLTIRGEEHQPARLATFGRGVRSR
ncbi:RICIN domain-containing protein [Amycolatopsis sp. TNS106]|uniref:RICIN domain-containing protein n=1 Tax=Amycolatopsis sp. TNS106 TaxID=2861750 RepID=UPI001C5842DB|nr:RICIN domain-containing protein [Amycolatopsis sp. TNS106]QXV56594.1 hypothetical protein CVV72_05880 [Amycolatopsis sp. TNS106]